MAFLFLYVMIICSVMMIWKQCHESSLVDWFSPAWLTFAGYDIQSLSFDIKQNTHVVTLLSVPSTLESNARLICSFVKWPPTKQQFSCHDIFEVKDEMTGSHRLPLLLRPLQWPKEFQTFIHYFCKMSVWHVLLWSMKYVVVVQRVRLTWKRRLKLPFLSEVTSKSSKTGRWWSTEIRDH